MNEDFLRRRVFDVLVPPSVQMRSPFAMTLFDTLITDRAVRVGLDEACRLYLKRRQSVEQTVSTLLRERNEKFAVCKTRIYHALISNRQFFDEYLGRPLTNGNEQCPYWGKYDIEVKERNNCPSSGFSGQLSG